MPKRERGAGIAGDVTVEDVQAVHMGNGDFVVRQKDDVTGEVHSVFLSHEALRAVSRMSNNILEMSAIAA